MCSVALNTCDLKFEYPASRDAESLLADGSRLTAGCRFGGCLRCYYIHLQSLKGMQGVSSAPQPGTLREKHSRLGRAIRWMP